MLTIDTCLSICFCLILSSGDNHIKVFSVHKDSVFTVFICVFLCLCLYQTSSVGEAQKLVAQAADLLSAIHSSIQHGIQSQNDTTKGGNSYTHFTHWVKHIRSLTWH